MNYFEWMKEIGAEVSERRQRGIRRVDLAYVEVASSELARDVNRDVVLELVRSRQPISRADLARHSGLQPSTISAIVEELLRDGWIAEGGTSARPRGRWPMMISLNPDRVMLVADVRPKQAILAVVDLNGRFLAREVMPLAGEAEKALQALADRMEEMRTRFPQNTFVGVGVSLPGRIDPETKKLIHAPNLKWKSIDIRMYLQQKLQLPVELDNAANACLLSELWFGRMDGIRDAVLVSLAEGVGAAILANGHLITGQHGMAGEFGHISMDPNGVECGCGQRGCWETISSTRAAVRGYQDLTKTEISYGELLHRAAGGDAQAREAIAKQARGIGQGIRYIMTTLAPQVVMIEGDIVSVWEIAGPILEEAAAKSVLNGPAPRIVPSSEGELGRLRGAAAVLLQRRSALHKEV